MKNVFFRYFYLGNSKTWCFVCQSKQTKDTLGRGCADIDADADQRFILHDTSAFFSSTPSSPLSMIVLWGRAILLKDNFLVFHRQSHGVTQGDSSRNDLLAESILNYALDGSA